MTRSAPGSGGGAVDAATGAMVGRRALLVGLGVTTDAVARALARRGVEVTVVEDRPSTATRSRSEELGRLGVDTVEAPRADELARLVSASSAVIPTPGLPERHPVFGLAAQASVPLRGELDLAAAWDDRPCLAITGTDGKTTVTTMVTAMLRAAGRNAVDAGNTEVPLVAAIDDPTVDVFVVEASSFRLGVSRAFRPKVATWLNFAPDHQDAHQDLAAYEAAKARVFANLTADELAVANADDPVVLRHAARSPRYQTFGLGAGADWHVDGERLVDPGGEIWLTTDQLWRRLPHDVANTLAAAATAVGGGADLPAVADAARRFTGLPHRVSPVAESDGVAWYDDSKATAPHATLAAVAGFESVVLLAGGRNKGLDLSPLEAAVPRLRGVVAMGEAADDLVAVFGRHRPVVVASSMDEAVAAGAGMARPGDAVILSPGCASFDWYRSYAERGDDFIRAVHAHLGETP